MIFTTFIISFTGLALFFTIKISEVNAGRKFFSTNVLDKSDIFINRNIAHSQFYFNVFLSHVNKIPIILDFFIKGIFQNLKKIKDLLIIKIVGFLNLDNVKNIERDRGSVSLFLKNISDDKKKK
ncbi:hypothetical protein KKC45_00145 [Patescibacteria group bacterium]|nr:hypothetical protein [Patescibacteria group bacterium]